MNRANDTLYFDLLSGARNGGQIDVPALVEGRVELPKINATGTYDLIRVGDAVSSRNMAAAMHDALRICAHV